MRNGRMQVERFGLLLGVHVSEISNASIASARVLILIPIRLLFDHHGHSRPLFSRIRTWYFGLGAR